MTFPITPETLFIALLFGGALLLIRAFTPSITVQHVTGSVTIDTSTRFRWWTRFLGCSAPKPLS